MSAIERKIRNNPGPSSRGGPEATYHAYAIIANVNSAEAGLDRGRGILGRLGVYAHVQTLAREGFRDAAVGGHGEPAACVGMRCGRRGVIARELGVRGGRGIRVGTEAVDATGERRNGSEWLRVSSSPHRSANFFPRPGAGPTARVHLPPGSSSPCPRCRPHHPSLAVRRRPRNSRVSCSLQCRLHLPHVFPRIVVPRVPAQRYGSRRSVMHPI